MSLSAPPPTMTAAVAAPQAPMVAPTSLPAPASPPSSQPPAVSDTLGRALTGQQHRDTLLCHWGDCQQRFENHVSLAGHLSEDHVGWKRPEYVCDWINCARRGVKCHSRFALMMHLRIHTGEKPFVCKHPGCDQAFGRQDALMRHKKAEHEQQDPKPARKHQPEAKAPSTKRRRVAAPSAAHHNHHPLHQTSSAYPHADRYHHHNHHNHYRRGSVSDDDDPSLTQTQRYKLAKAKLRYILRENEILNDEWMSIQKKLKHLQTERRVLLEVLMGSGGGGGSQNEDGMDLSDGDDDDGEDIDSQDSMLEDDEENN